MSSFDFSGGSPGIPMPPQRSSTSTKQVLPNAYSAITGRCGEQSRQMVTLREAITNEQNLKCCNWHK
jgi:hypothetical protein